MRKLWITAVISLQMLWWLPAGQVNAIVQKPEPLRIPPVILLLEDTPYYDNIEKDYPEHPAGILAPQDVQVLEGQNGWINERNRWKIKTLSGEKWIVTEPGTFDVPPPDTITLLEETSIYGSKSEKGEPNAVLSPQNVRVVGADKLWFQTKAKDDNGRVWLKISTTWLGDQWIHIPIGSVGYTRQVDRKEYLMSADVYDNPPIHYLQAKQVGEVRNRYVHVNGEFVTAFGKAYRIQTDIGDKWVNTQGTEITAANEEVELRTETPLFSTFLDTGGQLAILQPQTVTAFEKIMADPEGRKVWYHVRTAQGEGWVNRSLSAPENEVPINMDIWLHTQIALYQYPNGQMVRRYDPLSAQTVHAKAYWNDEYGQTWFRIDSYAGKAWIRTDPRLDKFLEPDGNSRLQITFNFPRMLPYVQSENRLHDFNEADVGFVKDGISYLAVSQIAKSFNYKQSGPSTDGYITLTPETRYAFKIKEGDTNAITLWNGRKESTVSLKAAPQLVNGELYLQVADAQTLFGAYVIQSEGIPVYYLAEKEYTVEAPEWPTATKTAPFQVKAYLYDQPEKSDAPMPMLYVYGQGGPGDPRQYQPSSLAETVIKLDQMKLFELSVSPKLQSGMNDLTVILKVGERIVWKYEPSIQSNE
ncbi:hypothetical protein [Paenibacillus radicis (ex Xue et al. 2023)]|uniref:Uncharacterized protein n=1 Tax=Paenibacillus radicis (ex Xue et al. 2023) TaxID=2972489 RepID=A0ABT1YH80_9BACL|nr:hypothetical protein [Paenibacillus radicis (ex Xue et al. 2023)]MCR8631305.1 hypothetical protein [Paenibacillus radicis (ex Xue et al. 2023)]